MAERNPAEVSLDADAGTAPLVATGPEGDAYRVKSVQRFLVLRHAVVALGDEEDTVPSRETWTSSMAYARHLVDPKRHKLPVCRCVKCRGKKKR